MDTTFAHDGANAAARRRLRILAVVLFTLLLCSLVASAGLWIALSRTRAELAGLAAVRPVEVRRSPPPRAAAIPEIALARPADPPREVPPAAPAPAPAAAQPAEDRLFLLLTVGTRHFAEKQLRLLRQHCRAPLAVYLQRRGRCGWSQCFAIAAREADLDRARSCGVTKGQALRERADFVLVQ